MAGVLTKHGVSRACADLIVIANNSLGWKNREADRGVEDIDRGWPSAAREETDPKVCALREDVSFERQ